MATLEEHQAAMVDLLANGSGIPASASRLAHAMHDVLKYLEDRVYQLHPEFVVSGVNDATTPGLNDKALSKREKALTTDSPAKWPTPAVKPPVSAENRVKELENTCTQLRKQSAQYRATISGQKEHIEHLQFELENARAYLDRARHEVECVRIAYDPDYCVPEQAGCRKEDAQLTCKHVCDHAFDVVTAKCDHCGISYYDLKSAGKL